MICTPRAPVKTNTVEKEMGNCDYFGSIRDSVMWLEAWSTKRPNLKGIVDMSNVDWINLGWQKITPITLSSLCI